MKVTELNWMQVEAYLRRDDRVALPLGSVEQHAWLSLGTDAILAERVALEAADPLGVPVYPALAYGLSPYFMAYPGTVTVQPATYRALIGELLDALAATGFRRILLVSGHGGNRPAGEVASAWSEARRDGAVARFHEWWRAPKTWAAVERAAPHGSHANWMESFPWTRVEDASGLRAPEEPGAPKDPVAIADATRDDPAAFRALLGDGSFGGAYRISDEAMLEIWCVAVTETRARLEAGWETGS
jgi:creatinine amidohydrolase